MSCVDCNDIYTNDNTNCLCESLKNWGGVSSSDWVIISLFSFCLFFAPRNVFTIVPYKYEIPWNQFINQSEMSFSWNAII